MSARAWLAAAALAAALPALAAAQPAPYRVQVRATPSLPRLGERVVYRALVTGGGPARVRVLPPEEDPDVTWGVLRSRQRTPTGQWVSPDAANRYRTYGRDESLFVEVPLQVFRTGVVSVSGLRLEVDDGGGPEIQRMPTLRLVVIPTVAAGDSNADLRPVRGPIPAPWWERVPWRWVGALALALAALIGLWAWLARRRPRPVPAAVPARVPGRPALAEALEALAALRAERLPERGRFDEHAFRLSHLLRRFLERVQGTPLPGDTTPELVSHLGGGRLAKTEVERVSGLLTRWDRVKFARAATSPEEAHQAEAAVEAMVRRIAAPAAERAA